MPRRNLIVICAIAIFSVACYQRAAMNRYVQMLAEVMGLISNKYVEKEKVRPGDLYESAVDGMVKRLDKHSQYFPPREYSRLRESLQQEFGGIGAEIGQDRQTQQFFIVRLLPGTPAFRTDLRPGDVIVKVDGHSAEGANLEKVIERIKGVKGQPVTLTVMHRNDPNPADITIVRDTIQVESVKGDHRKADRSWVFTLKDHPNIGYVRIDTFGQHTAEELRKILQFKNQPITGLIIDLRNNPGGLLDQAVEICDMFLEEGTIVSTQGRQGTQRIYKASPGVVVPSDLPVAILVNRFSASASEIMSACLQDVRPNTVIVGERSYGKGSVQTVLEVDSGKAALKLTTAGYSRPNGKPIHRQDKATEKDEWGVHPTEGYELKLTPEQEIGRLELWSENELAPGETREQRLRPGTPPSPPFDDPQIEKALDYLLPTKNSNRKAA